jgi:hypothetical protein
VLQKKKSKIKPEGFRKNKEAFDSVMNHLRRMGKPTLGHVGAVNIQAQSGGKPAVKNPAKPSMVDFWADVFLAIKVAVPKDIDLVKFHIAYTLYDSDDAIDRELWAQKVLHDRRHSVEQRLGAEFIRRGIHPVQGRGYFYAPRRA